MMSNFQYFEQCDEELLTFSKSFKFPRVLSAPLNASHTKQPKPHISVELEVKILTNIGNQIQS